MVATVPVGYADGYPRALSSTADVLIRGRALPGRGQRHDGPAARGLRRPATSRAGDEVVLLGSQGDEEVDAWELAGLADTIAYEIVTRIGQRVPRVYPGDGA